MKGNLEIIIRLPFSIEKNFSYSHYYYIQYSFLYVYINRSKLNLSFPKNDGIKIYLIPCFSISFQTVHFNNRNSKNNVSCNFPVANVFPFFFFFFSPRSRKHWNNLAPLENNTCATRWAYFMRLHALWLNIVPISVFNPIVSNYREFVTDWR